MKLTGSLLALALCGASAHAVTLEETRSAAGELRGLGLAQAATSPAPQSPSAAPVGRPELAVRAAHSYTAIFSARAEAEAALKRMADSFLASFKRALEPQYQVVSAPGPGVFRIRGAITGVQLVKPPLNPTDFIPIKALFNVARSSAGAAPSWAKSRAVQAHPGPSAGQ